MATKGASFRYGNSKGSNHRGEATKHIGYPWAKGFNKNGLDRHFDEHGAEFGCNTKDEYAAKAIGFANTIDRDNFKSVKDSKGTTYKYDPRDGRLAIITKDGYVVSYHHTGKKFTYYPRKGLEVTIWIKR